MWPSALRDGCCQDELTVWPRDVRAHPLLVGILAPARVVAKRQLRTVPDTLLILQRCIDNIEHAARDDGMPAKDRCHVDDQHGGAASRGFVRRRKPGDARTDHEYIGRGRGFGATGGESAHEHREDKERIAALISH